MTTYAAFKKYTDWKAGDLVKLVGSGWTGTGGTPKEGTVVTLSEPDYDGQPTFTCGKTGGLWYISDGAYDAELQVAVSSQESKAKFKIGDKVKLTGSAWKDSPDNPYAPHKGMIVTIKDVTGDGDAIFDTENYGKGWHIYGPNYGGELVTDEKQTKFNVGDEIKLTGDLWADDPWADKPNKGMIVTITGHTAAGKSQFQSLAYPQKKNWLIYKGWEAELVKAAPVINEKQTKFNVGDVVELTGDSWGTEKGTFPHKGLIVTIKKVKLSGLTTFEYGTLSNWSIYDGYEAKLITPAPEVAPVKEKETNFNIGDVVELTGDSWIGGTYPLKGEIVTITTISHTGRPGFPRDDYGTWSIYKGWEAKLITPAVEKENPFEAPSKKIQFDTPKKVGLAKDKKFNVGDVVKLTGTEWNVHVSAHAPAVGEVYTIEGVENGESWFKKEGSLVKWYIIAGWEAELVGKKHDLAPSSVIILNYIMAMSEKEREALMEAVKNES